MKNQLSLLVRSDFLLTSGNRTGLAQKREILIFPRMVGNTGIYRDILGNKVDSSFANIMAHEPVHIVLLFTAHSVNLRLL